MIQTIVKRDGREEKFNPDKIRNAIGKAFMEIDNGFIHVPSADIIRRITNEISILKNDKITVEEIQDIIEKKLMQSSRKDVAKAYILYRDNRTKARKRNSKLMKVIGEKLTASNVQNQNANVDENSFGGRRGEATSEFMKQYALDYCMSDMAKNNHLNNEIYIHDLDSYVVGMHNCLSIPFDNLLRNGFNTRQTDVRPAQSVSTAFQLVAVLFQIQSLQQFGGVAATHLDWTMIPYVRKSFYKHFKNGALYLSTPQFYKWFNENEYEYLKYAPDEADISIDKFENYIIERYNVEPQDNLSLICKYAMDMTEKEIYQAVEGMYHNLNTLQSRSGNQLPFSSINYGTCTLPEGRMITKALLDVSIKGIGKLHKTPIFPCGIFQYMKGVNDKPDTPNYDLYRLALKSTSLRLYPNYVNVDWSNNKGYDINNPETYMSTMGCRTANLWDINGLEQLKDGRGNICPVTIILPTIAMEVKESLIGQNETLIDLFLHYLSEKIDEAKDMLLERFEWICSQSPLSAKFMWENNLMAGYIPEEGIRSALKHGTLAIGQLGLAETLQILIGADHTTKQGMNLAKQIESLFKTKCAEYKEQYQLNFGVYYTPAENLCFTAMKKFKAKYGEIPNVSDKDYFTNSMHVPVWKELDPFEKIDIESQLTGYSSAGCITYVELPSSAKYNIDALETVVNYAMEKDIPYFAINVPNDTCLECGYTDEIGNICPKCGSTNIQRLRRVTGYLTGNYTTAFNLGKQQEVEMRVRHIK